MLKPHVQYLITVRVIVGQSDHPRGVGVAVGRVDSVSRLESGHHRRHSEYIRYIWLQDLVSPQSYPHTHNGETYISKPWWCAWRT
jgi:hypothetical protein